MCSCPTSPFLQALAFAVSALALSASAQPAGPAYYHDEAGQRHLTVIPMGGSRVEVRVRWAAEPGSTGEWVGQGTRTDLQLSFSAVVDEGQDRGAFFITKGGESKQEILFRPGQRIPQDPGILGSYRRVSDEKRLQLAKKEFQAADDRLAEFSKTASRSWPSADKPVAADWKGRWPALQGRWMEIAWQPPATTSADAKPVQMQPFAPKQAPSFEKEAGWWLKRAEATAMAYRFIQQPPDPTGKGEWEGDYDDGFGGRVSIRRALDGRLRVNLSCTRGNEFQGSDIEGAIPAAEVREKGGESSAEAVFRQADVPEDARDVQVTLRRKGGFLWVATKRKVAPPGSRAWFDGIYRWMPAPQE